MLNLPLVLMESLLLGLIIGGCVAGVIAIIVLIIVLIRYNKARKNALPKKTFVKSEYLEALGGESNILEHSLAGSRIILKLKDYDLVNKEELQEIGVDAFIMMSDKLTLVFKAQAEEGYKLIFGE